MPLMPALETADIMSRLEALPQWQFQENTLHRTTTFPTFMTAIAFVQAVAEIAEAQDHHPDIEIRYHRVTIRYWTHRAKGVTPLDFEGARAVETQIPRFQQQA